MSTSNRLPSRRQWLGNAAAASALAAWPAWADDYPSRPLKLVGIADIVDLYATLDEALAALKS